MSDRAPMLRAVEVVEVPARLVEVGREFPLSAMGTGLWERDEELRLFLRDKARGRRYRGHACEQNDAWVVGKLNQIEASQRELVTLVGLIAARSTSVTHLTIAECAQFLGCSERTIRNRVKRGEIRCEIVAGSSRKGIPISSLYSGWIDANDLSRRIGRSAGSQRHEE